MSHAGHNHRVSPLFTAQQLGCKAWDAGKSLDDCPYPALPPLAPSLTRRQEAYARAYRNAWIRSWRSREAGEPGVA